MKPKKRTVLLAFYFGLLLLPIYWMLTMSLRTNADILSSFVLYPADLTFKNYIKIFDVLPFAQFTWNTIIVTGLAVFGTVVSSAMVGYSFARLRWPGRQFFFALMISTMMLPEIVTLVPRFKTRPLTVRHHANHGAVS